MKKNEVKIEFVSRLKCKLTGRKDQDTRSKNKRKQKKEQKEEYEKLFLIDNRKN